MNTKNQNPENSCSICGSKQLIDFFEANNIPAQDGVVWPTKELALEAPVGEIKLAFCPACQYIYNRAYDPSKITFLDYDFSLHYSTTYQKFNEQLISSLIDNHGLHKKSILGVACGRGHFLVQLCETGQNQGLGIDPSYEITKELKFDSDQITFKKDYYSDKYQDLEVDFITCRHLIDELDDPVAFLQLFRQNLKKESQSGLYVEVPNTFKTFSKQLIWNIGYAKRSWFTSHSISHLLGLAGFQVTKVGKYLDGDYLGVEAIPANTTEISNTVEEADVLSILRDFSTAYYNGRQEWSAIFDRWAEKKTKVALWGAGMRGINFLSAFPRHETISKVVDINPHRQGKFLPTSAFQVEAPEVLQGQTLDVIIISNATYKQEIMEHARSLGFTGTFEIF